jgi:hypothetical protein
MVKITHEHTIQCILKMHTKRGIRAPWRIMEEKECELLPLDQRVHSAMRQ